MSKLIALNGPPGVGKSTLARRFVDDHPLALCIDIDQLRTSLGRWQDHEQSKLLARDLAVAMARTHLLAGFDVIVPQLLARPDYLDRLAGIAGENGAEFVHVLLRLDEDDAIVRFRARRAELSTAGTKHPEAEIDGSQVAVMLEATIEALDAIAATRSGTVVVDAGGDTDETYASLLGALRV